MQLTRRVERERRWFDGRVHRLGTGWDGSSQEACVIPRLPTPFPITLRFFDQRAEMTADGWRFRLVAVECSPVLRGIRGRNLQSIR